VRDGATLVVGAGLHPDALALAREVAAQRAARLIVAPPEEPEVELLARGAFQRRNFALARAAAQAFLGELDEQAVRAAAAATLVPGRFQTIDTKPETIFDGAHNAEGMAALAEALRATLAGRRLVAAVSILDDKDAAAMLRTLLPLCDEVVFCAASNPRALSPATLESLARQLDGPPARVLAGAHEALAAARAAAGPDGVAIATGSLYLIADLLRPPGAGRGSTL
jgi:dihydrofolate synthase / folylpolyglutamate synthase